MKRFHAIAGAAAMALIGLFWTATALSELFGATETIVLVKTMIPWGFLALIPALAATGGTGFRLGRGWRGGLVEAKRRRMRWVAANGILILMPLAFFLAAKAAAGAVDAVFYAAQAAELIAGAANLTLLSLNMRDGLRLAARRPARSASA